MKIKPNIKAPNFKLPCTDNSVFELNNFKKKNIILYFYPKDDTPGCTIEAKDFNKLNNLISKNKSSVFGVSKDSIESHLKFKKKYDVKLDCITISKKQFEYAKSLEKTAEKNQSPFTWMQKESLTELEKPERAEAIKKNYQKSRIKKIIW